MIKPVVSFFSTLLIVGTLALTPAVCQFSVGAEEFYFVSEQGVPLLPLCTTEDTSEEETHQKGDCAWSALSGLDLNTTLDIVPTPNFTLFKVSFRQQTELLKKLSRRQSGRAPPRLS